MVTITEAETRSILTPQREGALSGRFSYTLNPYRGCAFGCSYCYAKDFTHDQQLETTWGGWVTAKRNAPELLCREAGRLAGAKVFMSSATDPYQPAERKHRLTRACLRVMLSMLPGPELVHIHTRSPYVLDDLDLLLEFGDRLEVAVTVTTDDDSIRRIFEPHAPSIPRRLETLRALRDAGVRTLACVAPALPCDPESFARLIGEVTGRAFVDPVRFPKQEGYGLELYRRHGLTSYLRREHYEAVVRALRDELGPENISSRS